MIMKNKEFRNKCHELFQYLEDEYLCTVSVNETEFGMFITYINDTTSVRISFEPREGGLFILLSRLIEGKIPPYPIIIGPQTQIHSFYLDDILSLKAREIPEKNQDQLAQKPDALSEQLSFCSTMLKRYAKDILQGDFSIYPELECIVKKRAGRL